MMWDVPDLRNNLKKLDDKPAYVKWWAKRKEFDLLLDKLDVNYDDIKEALDIKDDLYCIFIGRPTNRSVVGYLKMQFNENSTYRLTISSILSSSQNNRQVVDDFLDKLKIEIFPIDLPVKSEEAKKELGNLVDSCLEKNLYILNIQKNYHPLAKNIKSNLSKIRKEAGKNDENNERGTSLNTNIASNEKRNIIYFGAPGTGKSYNLNKDKDKLLENYENNYERVTFHPDYSYANFVGTYKPVPENSSITYKYVPGPFMTVLKKALENPNEPYLLIIEEINRANVAAVFGDVFQLLDRAENNESVYPIDATEDMKAYINQDKIKIPQNMFIWATMNSADQGVFPMDTAFKRRWDFKYFGIDEGEDNIKNSRVVLNNKEIYWNDIRKEINEELLSYKINEDKLLGPFFVYNEYLNQEIPEDTFKEIFKNKIIMYLFEDAARSKRNDLFQGAKGNNKYVTYSEICEMFDERGLEIFCDNIKSKFIINDEDN